MSWKEKRLITILSIILAVLCAAVLVVLSIRYRAAQAAKDQNTVSPSDIAEAARAAVLVVLSIRYRAAQAAKDQNTVSPSDIAEAARSEYVALSYSNGSTTLSFSLNEDGVWTWDSEPDFPLDDTHVKSILTILETLKPQQTLDMPEDLSVYGLDAPDVSLTATSPDDAALIVTLGNATTDGTSYYANHQQRPDHVFILAGTRQAMQTPIYQMLLAGAAGIDGEHHHVHPVAGTVEEQVTGREQYCVRIPLCSLPPMRKMTATPFPGVPAGPTLPTPRLCGRCWRIWRL